MDAYSSFINNFLQARATVRLASMRPAFAKFLEVSTSLSFCLFVLTLADVSDKYSASCVALWFFVLIHIKVGICVPFPQLSFAC